MFLVFPQAAPLLSSQACIICGVKYEGLKIKDHALSSQCVFSQSTDQQGLPGRSGDCGSPCTEALQELAVRSAGHSIP